MTRGRRVAVVGSGIAGLAAAQGLSSEVDVTLFEADRRCGGHAHTVNISLQGESFGVDTGFLVFNDRTYPDLVRLFAELGVDTAPSEMSFSVQAPDDGLEWSGSDLNGVFGQRANLFRPRFLRMLAELLRFNRLATRLAESLASPLSDPGAFGRDSRWLQQPIGHFLDAHGFSADFRAWYLLPMVACIWSCPAEQMLRFPVATLLRFCHNHGLLQIRDRPQWMTVRGGSREYVRRMLARIGQVRAGCPVRGVQRMPPGHGNAGVWVRTDEGSERFDEVVLACHSDQSLALLDDAMPDERALLSAIRYQPNRAVLHTDERLLPRRARAWSAWNYERCTDSAQALTGVCLHYLINRLQPLPVDAPVIVSLNPVRSPDPRLVHGEYDYAHPVFDLGAIAAQQNLPAIQGRSHVWFCGAWTRYGFHEDGLRSGLAVVRALRDHWLAADQQGAAA